MVRVSGRGSGRISVAGLACVKTGQPGRFYYRMRGQQLWPGTRRAMSGADYAALITAAHRYLDAPVIVIRDNLNTHLSRGEWSKVGLLGTEGRAARRGRAGG